MAITNVMTDSGANLIARSLSEGKPIRFTKASLGTGEASGDMKALTALVLPFEDAEVAGSAMQGEGVMTVAVQYLNTHVSQSTYIKEIGVFGKLEGDSQEILFSYLSFGDKPDLILASSEASVQRTYDIPFIFSGASTASVTITPSALLSAREAVDAAEPHKLLRLNEEGKLDADIKGNAEKFGGQLPAYYAKADHKHLAATQTADGFLSKEDKKKLDDLFGRVNQDLRKTAKPTFAGLTVDGFIDGARFR